MNHQYVQSHTRTFLELLQCLGNVVEMRWQVASHISASVNGALG